MQRYLLFVTVASHIDDDDLLSNSGACLINSFSTIEECIKTAREDLLEAVADIAIDATNSEEGSDEVNDYIQMYVHDTAIFDNLTDADFPHVGSSRHIIDSEYHSDYWCDSHIYTVVRIA